MEGVDDVNDLRRCRFVSHFRSFQQGVEQSQSRDQLAGNLTFLLFLLFLDPSIIKSIF